MSDISARLTDINLLNLSHEYAEIMTGCTKVSVGSAIIKEDGNKRGRIISFGANRAIPNTCKTQGCYRVKLYGDNDKTHRAPGDCHAIHSEVDAIINAKTDLTGATIIITRYPCEACARAIVTAGIKKVVYGRAQKITELTKEILEGNGVEIVHIDHWNKEDVTN